MKVVIIEGPDNTGKTTVIHELMEKYDNVYYMHATKPAEKDPVKCALDQKQAFKYMIENIKTIVQARAGVQLIILDRSWVGEYVYGCLYRGNGDAFVKDMISECYHSMSKIYTGMFSIDFITILYTASPEFCSRNDDGKSISKGRKDAIKKEIDRFEEIIKLDCVTGKKCIINVENEDGQFKQKEEILNMTMNVINSSEVGLYIDGKLPIPMNEIPEDDGEEKEG